MDLDNYLGFLGEGMGSLLLVLGALAGAGVMSWAAKYYQRICRQHGNGLAACGLTGELVAQRLLAACGLSEVKLVRSRRLNFYHPRKREVHLSATNFESPTLLALTTAAHEVGHAQQFASEIVLCRLRRIFWPICYVLIGLAVVLPLLCIAEVIQLPTNIGTFMLILGVVVVLLQLPVHLPLEYDASQRARRLVQEAKLVGPGEQGAFDEMLKAAWFTHAAHVVQGGILLLAVAVMIFYVRTS